MKKLLSIMLILILVFTYHGAFAAFYDIDNDTFAWSGEAIENLTELGVINGYEDGTFRPNGNITRAEFAKMLSVAFDLKNTDISYDDISDHWAYEYINSSASIMHTSGASFNPDVFATRLDIAYAAASVLDLEALSQNTLNKFTDGYLVEDDVKSNLIAAVENGIILGYEDMTIRPYANVTRAEAAVIVYRALNIKNNAPGDMPLPEENKPSDEVLPEDDKPQTDNKHIYTLYPGKDLILVSSVTSVSLQEKGEDAYRIKYRLANSEEEYTSVIPYDVDVRGVRSDASQLKPGDVLIMDTAFHGHIGYLYVFAAFDHSVPFFDTSVDSYNKGKYTLSHGRITNIEITNRVANLTIDTGSETKTEMILLSVDTNVYSPWNKNAKWSLGDLGEIDIENEDVYVFIRYTDGVATDIILSDITR